MKLDDYKHISELNRDKPKFSKEDAWRIRDKLFPDWRGARVIFMDDDPNIFGKRVQITLPIHSTGKLRELMERNGCLMARDMFDGQAFLESNVMAGDTFNIEINVNPLTLEWLSR